MRLGEPDGHGIYGQIDQASDGKLLCHECGKGFHQLATHVRYAHGYASAADYREAHGLKRTEKMASPTASAAMKKAWDTHRDLHLESLKKRDPAKATQASRQYRQSEWTPAARQSRLESLKARRGRDLTDEEHAWLSEAIPLSQWCRRARAILDSDPRVTQRSISRSLGLTDGAVQQRLRRYPS